MIYNAMAIAMALLFTVKSCYLSKYDYTNVRLCKQRPDPADWHVFGSIKGIVIANQNPISMKRTLIFLGVVLLVSSCSRSVTIHQAANNHYKKCRPIR